METISSACFDTLKRYWRRRRYQRLHNIKRKLKIIRLGGGTTTRRFWKLRTTTTTPPKLQWKLLMSPIRMLMNFHDAYVNLMIRLSNNMDKSVFRGKKVARDKQISMVSCGDEVDTRLVLDIYKRLVASRELRGF